MVAKRDKEVKEQRRPTVPHLELHSAAALERAAAADYESKVVGSELGVGVGGVGVGIAGGGEDRAALDAGFCRYLVRTSLQLTLTGCKDQRENGENSRSPCFRNEIFFKSSSPYFSPAQ